MSNLKVSHSYPPNHADIVRVFGAAALRNAIYTYGDTVYIPQGLTMVPNLEAHEFVHTQQQTDPAAWWARYLEDPAFRLEQELEAYRAQYQYSMAHDSRQVRRQLLKKISKDLSGPLYGRIISAEEAREAITA